MSFLVELIFDLLMPGPVFGQRKRERERREMWQRRAAFPAMRRNEQFATWAAGTGQAEAGQLLFDAPPMSSTVSQIENAIAEGNGPPMFGPTTLVRLATATGHNEVFAVPADYANRITATLVPGSDPAMQ